ncbi:hypothetical protein HNY73_004083 [Argiope bruennichi]|uniref:Uncharacterized protein n=1 Tax=Argiope bruennichi TaxID=94029 RepID=A0A8T0FMS7_ARGBR|nr:hypothetical protein HNY73_004083 [Argiope bruennichi]
MPSVHRTSISSNVEQPAQEIVKTSGDPQDRVLRRAEGVASATTISSENLVVEALDAYHRIVVHDKLLKQR